MRGGVREQRVAIRIGLGDQRDADRTASAALVLDHDRLAELLR